MGNLIFQKMGKLIELEMSEMIEISGGNRQYDLGYVIGLSIRRSLDAIEFVIFMKR